MITPTQLFSLAFWKTQAAVVVSVFATSFLGSLAAYTTAPSVKDVEIAAWSALAGAVAYFLHSVGATSATKAGATSAVTK
jgi:hypothetical protein